MEDGKIYDEHHLYIANGLAKEPEIEKALQNFINEAKVSNPKYKINLLKNAERYFGYGYIWVESTELYWLLLGVRPASKREINVIGASWSSVMDQNEQETTNSLSYLDPTGEQVVLEVYRAFVYEPEPKYMRNRLCAREVPDFVTVKMLKNLFEGNPYIKFIDRKASQSSQSKTKDTKSSPKRIVFITFDRDSDDALFALLMSKKVKVTDPKTKKHSLIYFNYAYTK